jgi:hypothetical protein
MTRWLLVLSRIASVSSLCREEEVVEYEERGEGASNAGDV